MENKNSHLVYFTLLGVVAVVAIMVVSMAEQNLGSAVVYDRVMIDDLQYDCMDTDTSNDFFVRGTVKHENYQYNDFCSDDKLFQIQCASSQSVELIHGYDCPNGCRDGACVR